MNAIERVIWRCIALGACAAVAACTEYWAKPGGTPAEFEAAKANCQTRAYADFPPALRQVMVSPGYTTPLQTVCNGGPNASNCIMTGGQYSPPSFMMVDQNEAGRNSAARSCLFAAGWQPAKNKEDAEAISRSAP
nr:hypothetical protein [uncultured Rhodopila sp.]